MRILVIGGGGREHALVWKLAQSPHAERIYCAPGNAGIARHAECINLKVNDIGGLADFADRERIDLTVVGPEGPLIAGIVDRFEARGLPIFGPSTDCARLEGSKVFSKDLMVRYGIPTADYHRCDDAASAHERVEAFFSNPERSSSRLVIKADGIAAGKGVVLASTANAAHTAVDEMMVQRVFGDAGATVLIEECLEGQETSIMAISDGDHIVTMPPSQDHKRIFDNDMGPNTGGMGAYSPVPIVTYDLIEEIERRVLRPTIEAIRDLGIPYKGVLYAGIMLTTAGPKVLEFNCRFGDPETQAVLPLLDSDLVEILDAAVNCRLDDVAVHWKEEASVCVVASSGGYPGEFVTGKLIEGLGAAAQVPGATVFHAGTREHNGQYFTDGGRVLGVNATAITLREAVQRAYQAVDRISFEGMHVRRDIAGRAMG